MTNSDAAKMSAQKRWRLAHPDQYKAIRRAKYRKAPELYIAKAMAAKAAMLERKAGRPKPAVCEVCGGDGKICFDHCHATGAFRGWLCHGCNSVLGYAKDDPDTLVKLAKYLRAAQKAAAKTGRSG